jgi:uncharacterized integral membrane protein
MMTKSAKIKIGVVAVLAVLMVVVILQNTDPVKTRFLFVEVVMPQIVLLLITLVVGAFGGIIAGELWAGRKKR